MFILNTASPWIIPERSTAPQHTRFILPLTSPDKIIAALRGRFSLYVGTLLENFISRLSVKASRELTCKLLNPSLSTFIRRAIHNVKIEKTVIVAGGGEETLTAVSTLAC